MLKIFIYLLFYISIVFISWIDNFITGRMFKVCINKTQSSAYSITCGVPQGAVLSPILFSLYIDDIPKLELPQYNSEESANKIIKFYLVRLQEWLDKWRISMAVHKCAYLIFNNSHRKLPDLDLSMNNTKIERSSTTIFHGVTLDEKLNFKAHAEKMREKAASLILLMLRRSVDAVQ